MAARRGEIGHSKDLASENQGQHLHSIRDGLTNPRVLLLSAIYFFFTMGLYGVSFWLPSIVKASGVTDTLNIGLLSSIPYAAAAVAMVLVSRNSDATGERRWHLSLAGVIGALALCTSVYFAHDTLLAMIALTIGTMGVMTTISQFWVLPPAILSGGAAAAGIALTNSVGSVSGIVSPYVIGWVQQVQRHHRCRRVGLGGQHGDRGCPRLHRSGQTGQRAEVEESLVLSLCAAQQFTQAFNHVALARRTCRSVSMAARSGSPWAIASAMAWCSSQIVERWAETRWTAPITRRRWAQ
jgi:hypothetical protein